MAGIKHILGDALPSSGHGQLQRYHQMLKGDVNQVPHELPADLEACHRRLRQLLQLSALPQAPGNVTPSDALRMRREQILQRRKEVQTQTIRATKTPRRGPQGAHQTIQHLISPGLNGSLNGS